jgi:hypothetical protein
MPLRAGALYFCLVFVVGWVLGPIRELLIVPHAGRTAGVLIEAPLMLAAMILAARWTTRRLAVAPTLGTRITAGLVALGLLLAAEVAGARWLRGQPIRDYLAGFASIPGGASLVLFLVFAAMPAIVMRCEACGARSSAPRRSG